MSEEVSHRDLLRVAKRLYGAVSAETKEPDVDLASEASPPQNAPPSGSETNIDRLLSGIKKEHRKTDKSLKTDEEKYFRQIHDAVTRYARDHGWTIIGR